VPFRLLGRVHSYHTMSNLVVANWPVKFVLFSLKILQTAGTFMPWDYISEYSIRLFYGTTATTATTALVASSINEDQLRDQRISMTTLKIIKEHIKTLHEFEKEPLRDWQWCKSQTTLIAIGPLWSLYQNVLARVLRNIKLRISKAAAPLYSILTWMSTLRAGS